MSFQAYLDTIEKKTGKSPDDFYRMAEEKGLMDGTQLKLDGDLRAAVGQEETRRLNAIRPARRVARRRREG